MAEIVGQDPTWEEVKHRVTCKGCGAIIEYRPEEVLERLYTIMGDNSGHNYVPCPRCAKDARIRSW